MLIVTPGLHRRVTGTYTIEGNPYLGQELCLDWLT